MACVIFILINVKLTSVRNRDTATRYTIFYYSNTSPKTIDDRPFTTRQPFIRGNDVEKEIFYLNTSCTVRELSQKHYSRLLILNNTKQLLYKIDKTKINDKYNTIFGMAYGYEKDRLYMFIESLKKNQYQGEIILFVRENITEETKSYMRSRNVTMIYLIEDWPYYSDKNVDYPLKRETILKKIPKKIFTKDFKYGNIRGFLINAFLSEYSDANRMYLSTDTKDVFFQLHPFSYQMPRGLIINEEPRIFNINENGANNWFMSKFYPRGTEIYFNFIYNSGVFYFTYPEVVPLLDDYANLMANNPNDQLMDQAAFIISIIKKPKDNYYYFHDGLGPVRNIGIELIKMRELFKNKKNRTFTIYDTFVIKDNTIINYDCSIPAIIHMYTQYDNSELTDFLNSTLIN